MAGVALLGAAGCGGSGAAGNGLVFTSYGGSFQQAQEKAWLEPFSKETGIEIRQDSPTDYAKLRAMVENNQVTWDVVDVVNDFGLESTADLLEPIDYSVIDREPILDGYASEYRIANILSANVLGYNTEKVEGAPEGWADFFDLEKFPGERGLYKNPSQTLELALLGDGVSPELLYPLDVDRALAKLDTIRDRIVWWESGNQSAQLIADGEVAMVSAWSGRVQTAIDSGAPVKIQWEQNVQIADYLIVPKGTQNKERAMELIAYIVSAENNHRISNFISYAPVNEKSIPKLDQDVASRLPTAYRDIAVPTNDQWWDDNREEATERFNEWLLG